MTLVIGGAASGKSRFAEEWVMRLPGKRIYLATMEALDAESEARIARHRLLRAGRGFETLECSLDLSHCAVPDRANVLLEDLPNLLANEMFRPGGGGERPLSGGRSLPSVRHRNGLRRSRQRFLRRRLRRGLFRRRSGPVHGQPL